MYRTFGVSLGVQVLRIFHQQCQISSNGAPDQNLPLIEKEHKKLSSKAIALAGVALVAFYLLRVSVVSSLLPVNFFTQGSRLLLIFSAFTALFSGQGLRFAFSALGMLLLTIIGSIFSMYGTQALLNWAGWCLIVIALGPCVIGGSAQQMRQISWGIFRLFFVGIGVLSFFWYLAGLPVLGRGAFTGVMVHSMLLAPIAGFAVIFLMHRAIKNRSIIAACFSFLSVLSCLLSGSRSATVSTVFGLLVLLFLWFLRLERRQGIFAVSVVCFGLLVSVMSFKMVWDSDLSYRYTSTLQQKALNNSRDRLWAARLQEFKDNPIAGVGIGVGYVGEWVGAVQTESGDINVEPGSSYLAILSMTGLLGVLGFVLVMVRLIRLCRPLKVKIRNADNIELFAVLVFFAIHMTAEGYIFAVGNSLCLFFWLSLGRLQDLFLAIKIHPGVESKLKHPLPVIYRV